MICLRPTGLARSVSTRFSPNRVVQRPVFTAISSRRLIWRLLSWTGVKPCGRAGGWRRRSSAAHRTQNGGGWAFWTFFTAGFARERLEGGYLLTELSEVKQNSPFYTALARH